MDDLDHSMCRAEDEWMRFCEECEECALPQPQPASPDYWGLSDLEDSDFTAGHEGQEPPATGDKAKPGASRRGGGNRSLSGGENDDLSSNADSESERWVLCPNGSAINAAEVDTRAAEHVTSIATWLQTEYDPPAGDGLKADREWQSDASSTCDPLPHKLGAEDLSGNGPRGAAGAASGGALRTEKDRWFVTVIDSPARQRVRVTSAKKKRRLKQPRKNKRPSQSSRWEKQQKNHVEFEANNEKVRGNNHKNDKSSSKHTQKANVPANPGLSQLSLTSGQHDGAKYEPSCQAPSLHDGCSHTGLPGSDGADVPADTAECWESHTPPAAQSFGKPQQLLMEPEERPATPPSAAHTASRTPDGASVCDTDTRGPRGPVAALTSAAPTHEMNSSPSVCGLPGDQLSPASVPPFTPCSAADSPETHAAAAGHARPAYAISAFWDDMEKVTINDILQLRVARGAPLGVADKSPQIPLERNHCSSTDSKSAGAVPLDTSDTADSDYFTQLDESRPDHWGGDLSASDFEEERLLGASRSSSPDLRPRPSCSPYLADEEGESTASEGMETPVPAGDLTQAWYGCSGARMLPLDVVALGGADPPARAVTEGGSAWTPLQLEEQQIWETFSVTRREGIFSRFRQSDMCLACIAFASWVLRSADPESADAWKGGMKICSNIPLSNHEKPFLFSKQSSGSICDENQASLESPSALLASVSALSAIRYLRQNVVQKPSPDGP